MKLVIDSNRIIASLIKDSYSRSIIYNRKFEFFTPQFATEEIYKYKKYILDKSGMNEKAFEDLIMLIFQKIIIVSKENYSLFIKQAEKIISDMKDAPFIALCLALDTEGVWSDDKHFLAQKKVRVFTTKDLLEQ